MDKELAVQTVIGKMAFRDVDHNGMFLETQRMKDLFSEELTILTSNLGILEIVEGKSPLVNKYLYTQFVQEKKEEYKPQGPTKGWENFKYMFSRDEIISFVSLLPMAQRKYFTKMTYFGTFCVSGQKVNSFLTMLNVEAMVSLVRFTITNYMRKEEGACGCEFSLSEMPLVPMHTCIICGGQSDVDETLKCLPMTARKMIATERVTFLPNSMVIVKIEDKHFAKRTRGPKELSEFLLSVQDGTVQEIPTSIGIDMREEHENNIIIKDDYNFSVLDKNVVVVRAKVVQGLIEEMCTFEINSHIVRRVGAWGDFQSMFSERSILVDPQGEMYRGLMQGKPFGGMLMPRYTTQTRCGFSYTGIEYKGTVMQQLQQAVRAYYGIKIPSVTTYGAFSLDGQHQLRMKTKRVVALEAKYCNQHCGVCRSIVEPKPFLGVYAYHADPALTYCDECIQMIQLYTEGSYKRLYGFLELDSLTDFDIEVMKDFSYRPRSLQYPLCKGYTGLRAMPRYLFSSKQECEYHMLRFQFSRIIERARTGDILNDKIGKRLSFLGNFKLYDKVCRTRGIEEADDELKRFNYWTIRNREFLESTIIVGKYPNVRKMTVDQDRKTYNKIFKYILNGTLSQTYHIYDYKDMIAKIEPEKYFYYKKKPRNQYDIKRVKDSNKDLSGFMWIDKNGAFMDVVVRRKRYWDQDGNEIGKRKGSQI